MCYTHTHVLHTVSHTAVLPSAYVVCYVWAPKQTFVVSFLSRPHAQFLIIMRPHERHQQWHITCSQRTPLRTPFSQDSQRVIGLAWAPHKSSSWLKRIHRQTWAGLFIYVVVLTFRNPYCITVLWGISVGVFTFRNPYWLTALWWYHENRSLHSK